MPRKSICCLAAIVMCIKPSSAVHGQIGDLHKSFFDICNFISLFAYSQHSFDYLLSAANAVATVSYSIVIRTRPSYRDRQVHSIRFGFHFSLCDFSTLNSECELNPAPSLPHSPPFHPYTLPSDQIMVEHARVQTSKSHFICVR